MGGPFYDPEKERTMTPKAPRSHRRNDDTYDDNWSKDIPNEVGKQGRRKNMARLEKRAREQEEADDDDWFNKPGNIQIRGRAKQDDSRRRDEPRKTSKLSFGKSIAEAGRRLGAEDSKQPSLLARISDDRGSSSRGGGDDRDRYRERHGRYDREDRDRRRRHGRNRDSEYEKDRDRHQNRPRYKGGYTR